MNLSALKIKTLLLNLRLTINNLNSLQTTNIIKKKY